MSIQGQTLFNRNQKRGPSRAASLLFADVDDSDELEETEEETVTPDDLQPEKEEKEAVAVKVEPVEEEPELSPEELKKQRMEELYALIESNGGPSASEIQIIKDKMGRVHVIMFDDDRMVIIRPLKRIEYKNFKDLQAKQKLSNDDLEEQIVQRCLVFPKLDTASFNQLEGGLVSSIYKEIMETSLFLSDDVLSSITIKL